MQFGLWRATAFVSSPIHLFHLQGRFYVPRDRETGVDTIVYSVTSRHRIMVDGVDIIVINVHLNCVLDASPWCLAPQQLTPVMAAERARIPPDHFGRLEESMKRHRSRT